MNTGHESLTCESCHLPARGSLRQQLQGNVRYLFGLGDELVDFGLVDVSNADCLACHERPNDRHPVFRFEEPRFAEARRELAPHQCNSCHREHSGKRVTVEADYCSQCHADLAMEKDPLDVSHAELVAAERWSTCLGCHSFHGNHVMQPATVLAKAYPKETVVEYFEGGPSPYPPELHHRAKTRREGTP